MPELKTNFIFSADIFCFVNYERNSSIAMCSCWSSVKLALERYQGVNGEGKNGTGKQNTGEQAKENMALVKCQK